MFSGADDWNVVITVTNTENGVEIAKANCPKEELIIEPEMWDEQGEKIMTQHTIWKGIASVEIRKNGRV